MTSRVPASLSNGSKLPVIHNYVTEQENGRLIEYHMYHKPLSSVLSTAMKVFTRLVIFWGRLSHLPSWYLKVLFIEPVNIISIA